MSSRSASFKVRWSHAVVLAIVIIAVLPFSSLGLSAANITGSPYHGLYSIPGRAVVDTTASYLTKEVDRHCACRIRCFTHRACEAYWLVPLASGSYQCHLSKGGPFVHKPQPLQGAYYGYKKHDLAEFDIDGMLYKLTTTNLTWDDAVQECKDMEGYQLGMYKTKEQRIIVLKYDATLADTACTHVYLTDTTGVIRWGDGTPYTEYESSLFFYIYNNNVNDDVYDIAFVLEHGLQDRSRSMECRNLCQSDPFNLMLP